MITLFQVYWSFCVRKYQYFCHYSSPHFSFTTQIPFSLNMAKRLFLKNNKKCKWDQQQTGRFSANTVTFYLFLAQSYYMTSKEYSQWDVWITFMIFFYYDYYINGKKYFKTFCYIFLINCIISKLRKISSLLLLLFWWMFKSLWLVPLFHCFETSYAHQDCIYFIKIHWKQHF